MKRGRARTTLESMITNSLDVAATATAAHTREAALTVSGVRKSYGSVQALDGVDLTVRRGEVLALLGPNGAGKTTLTEILEGHRRRTGGTVSVLGHDPGDRPRDLRARVGIVLQGSGFYPRLTAREALVHWAGLYPAPRDVDQVIALTGLEDAADRRVRTLSGGQRRRLDFALALVGDPELIFLDEPTTGFDPSARRRSWKLIDNLRALGKTILLTTHYMDEAQNLADRVAVLAAGRIVAEGSPASLGGRDVAEAEISFRLPAGAALDDLPPLGPARPRLDDGRVVLRTEALTGALHALTGWALARGDELEGLAVTRPSLEDVYLRLTGGDRLAEGDP